MPSGSGETGNPVFDYRAIFRRRAASAQFALTLAGVVLLISAAGCGLAGLSRNTCVYAGAAGTAAMVAGLAWGLYWRRALRAEFRRLYGPPGQ